MQDITDTFRHTYQWTSFNKISFDNKQWFTLKAIDQLQNGSSIDAQVNQLINIQIPKLLNFNYDLTEIWLKNENEDVIKLTKKEIKEIKDYPIKKENLLEDNKNDLFLRIFYNNILN